MRLEDEFEILKVLGRGGFGLVLQVREKKTKVVWAAKVLKEVNPHQRQVFAREVKQLLWYRRFRHVVRVERAYLDAERPFFLMAYAPGGAVTPWAGKLSERQTLSIMRQLMETLAQMHAQNGLHRDVKPDNLLLLADGTSALTDFGLGNSPKCTVHFTMNAYGTVGYLAPELLQGGFYAPSCDIFSAGVTWFQLVTGRSPVKLNAPFDVRIAKSPGSPWIGEVIRKMTSPEPSSRPTAFSILQALTAALGGKDEKLPNRKPNELSDGEKLFLGALGLAAVIGLFGAAK